MKNLLPYFLLLFSLLLIVSSGCKKEEAVLPNEPILTEEPVTINAPVTTIKPFTTGGPITNTELLEDIQPTTIIYRSNARFIDEATDQLLTSRDQDLLTYSARTALLDNIAVGDVIVSTNETAMAKNGYVRKVNEVMALGSGIAFQTTAATLTDYIYYASIHLPILMTGGDLSLIKCSDVDMSSSKSIPLGDDGNCLASGVEVEVEVNASSEKLCVGGVFNIEIRPNVDFSIVTNCLENLTTKTLDCAKYAEYIIREVNPGIDWGLELIGVGDWLTGPSNECLDEIDCKPTFKEVIASVVDEMNVETFIKTDSLELGLAVEVEGQFYKPAITPAGIPLGFESPEVANISVRGGLFIGGGTSTRLELSGLKMSLNFRQHIDLLEEKKFSIIKDDFSILDPQFGLNIEGQARFGFAMINNIALPNDYGACVAGYLNIQATKSLFSTGEIDVDECINLDLIAGYEASLDLSSLGDLSIRDVAIPLPDKLNSANEKSLLDIDEEMEAHFDTTIEEILGWENCEVRNWIWSTFIGGSNYENANDMIATSDGGYLIVGSSTSSDGDVSQNNGGKDMWIVKLDAGGNVEWEKSFGGIGDEEAWGVTETPDNDFLVVGHNSKYTDEDNVRTQTRLDSYNYGILKLSSSGALIWEKSIGGTEGDKANDVQIAADGSYLILGTTDSEDGDVSDGATREYSQSWLVNLDENGNILWEKSWGLKLAYTLGNSLLVDDAGNILTTGQDDGWNIHNTKLTASGEILFNNRHDYNNTNISDDQGKSIIQTTDGGYLIGGFVQGNRSGSPLPNYHGSYDGFLTKTDASGNVEWEKAYGGSGYDVIQDLVAHPDGGYVFLAQTSSSDGDISDNIVGNRQDSNIWIGHVDEMGNLISEKTYNREGNSSDYPKSIVVTEDGHYVVAGSSGFMNTNYWIVKVK